MQALRAPIQRVRLVALLALWLLLAGRVPAAISASALSSQIWSVQLHGGLFSIVDAQSTSPMVGMRYGKHFGSHLQGGVLTGWTMKRKKVDEPVNATSTVDPRVVVGQTEASLVPVMAFLQMNFTESARLVPFVGIGAGYERLVINNRDDRTGLTSSATYDNLAWEGFGGVGLRLTSKVRLNGELFYNGGALERGVVDADGHAWREAVFVNGVGLRAGLDMVFE